MFIRLTILLLICSFSSLSFAQAVRVQVMKAKNGWQLLRNGKPYYVKGVGGDGHLDLLKQLGGNSFRTWSVQSFEEGPILQQAKDLGLTVAAGLGLEHERHGFKYDDAAAVKKQFDRAIAEVEKYKNESPILVWGIGNEMEGDGNNPAIWKAVNDIAREIHRRDPNHPTMTVIAGSGKNSIKLINFMKYCPDVDILGINSYGGMANLLEEVKATKLDRPYIATEFGPIGWWEIRKTSWDVPVEQTSSEKAATYRDSYRHSVRDAGPLSFGSYAFLWGAKQERTHTWFNLLLPDNPQLDFPVRGTDSKVSKTEAVDMLSYEWTGKWPSNRTPSIARIQSDASEKRIAPGTEYTATVKSEDPDNDPLAYSWEVREETSDAREGGDAEKAPPAVSDAVVSVNGNTVKFKAPAKPGPYRLFVLVRDGKGSVATTNMPFFVEEKK
ncbi:MAG TPA: hypothetical protein VN577_14980 [Terriglobales bacterium]|nr:hypothetical protein [Terriglobales bacterium]